VYTHAVWCFLDQRTDLQLYLSTAAFYEQLKKRAESIKQCDPLTEDCRMGPVVNQDQYDKIMGFIEVMPVSFLFSCSFDVCVDKAAAAVL